VGAILLWWLWVWVWVAVPMGIPKSSRGRPPGWWMVQIWHRTAGTSTFRRGSQLCQRHPAPLRTPSLRTLRPSCGTGRVNRRQWPSQMPHDSAQLWRRDKPTAAHGPWFQQQERPFWELRQTWNAQPRFNSTQELAAHTNPFYHADRYSIDPPPHASKPASDPHAYVPNAERMDRSATQRLPLFKVPKYVKRNGCYVDKVGENTDFRPKSPPKGSTKQVYEWPDYPTQGRRFTDVQRHFAANIYADADREEHLHETMNSRRLSGAVDPEERPLYSSFTKDKQMPVHFAQPMEHLNLGGPASPPRSRLSSLGGSSRTRNSMGEGSNPDRRPASTTQLPSEAAIMQRHGTPDGAASRSGATGGGRSGSAMEFRGTYLRTPTLGRGPPSSNNSTGAGGRGNTRAGGGLPPPRSRSRAMGVRAGGLQMMLAAGPWHQ
jgi:hypothetical protein